MKRLFFIVPVLIFGLAFISFLPIPNRVSFNINTWHLSYNNKVLIFESGPRMDTTLVLKTSGFQATDTIYFGYYFDYFPKDSFTTKLYLGTAGQKGTLVSKETTKGHLSGKFSVLKLKGVADECKCSDLEFSISDNGIRNGELLGFVKFKVIN
jgi:hypothetical protein